MRGEFHTLLKASHLPRFVNIAVVLMASVLCVISGTQAAMAAEPQCFTVSVSLNGQPIQGPQSVTLKARKSEATVALEQQKCFMVPKAVAEGELIEVSFTVPGSQIHMSDVPADFLNGSWDVLLADKKFGKEVTVPKKVNAAEICALVVHSNGSDQSFAQPQCRTPLTATATAKQ